MAKESKAVRIDFSGVEKDIHKRGRKIPEGTYVCKIVDHKKGWKDDDKSNPPYFRWRFQVAEGKHKGVPLYYITSLKPDALFNLRNLIFAATDGAKNVAGKKLDFNPQSLYGKKIGVLVEDEEYEGKIRSRPVDVQPLSEMQDSDDGDEDEDEDDEDVEDEDEDDEDEDDDEEEEEEPAPKKKKGKKKKKKSSDDDDDLDEVDVDEL